MKWNYKFFCIWVLMLAAQYSTTAQSYTWQNVAIGGGGYALQVATHPVQANNVYAAVDVAGLFRWDDTAQKWNNLNAWMHPDSNHLFSCDGFALDPNQANTIYACFGRYACDIGGIFKSTDKGAHWTRIYSARFGGNMNKRYVQTGIAVDPVNSNVVYCGTRTNGLLRSTNAGNTWSAVGSVPAGITGTSANCYADAIGIRAVVIDKSSTTNGNASRVYVSIPGTGIYRSADGGVSFSLMAGSPSSCTRISVWGANGGLLATADNGVYRFDGTTWANITPTNASFASFNALDVDPANANQIICSTGDLSFYQQTFRSTDGGNTWTKITALNGKATVTYTVPWFPTDHSYFQAATSSLTFDPLTAGRVYMTDWFSIWKTDNIWATPVVWTQQNNGYEVTVNLALSAPSSGAPLFSGFADIMGFRHTNPAAYPVAQLFDAAGCTGIDFQAQNSNNLAAIICDDHTGGNTRIITSADNGLNWVVKNIPAGKTGGKIAISASNVSKMVYLPALSTPFYSIDGGTTWLAASGAPTGSIQTTSIFQYQNPLTADRSTGNKFYLYKPETGKVYASTDGGANWAITNAISLPTSQNSSNFVNISTGFTPSTQNHLWISLGANGLWHSTDGGVTFAQMAGINTARLSALGLPISPSTWPTVYVYGKVGTQWGMYQSTDNGSTWVLITENNVYLGGKANVIAADLQTPGSVYVGSNGRGIYWGRRSSQISAKIFLQGPYSTANALMNDGLRAGGFLPLVTPYGGTETTTSAVLAVSGTHAIVDWVKVELRDKNAPSTVRYTLSALLQRDGDVVATDGVSPLTLKDIPYDQYYVAIRHRNHLGCRTAAPVLLNENTAVLNFSDGSTLAYGSAPLALISGVYALYSGDANGDGTVNAIDRNASWRPQNGQSYNYTATTADFDLNATVNAVDRNAHWRINNSRVAQF